LASGTAVASAIENLPGVRVGLFVEVEAGLTLHFVEKGDVCIADDRLTRGGESQSLRERRDHNTGEQRASEQASRTPARDRLHAKATLMNLRLAHTRV
jgi:hypothetical protein